MDYHLLGASSQMPVHEKVKYVELTPSTVIKEHTSNTTITI
jgi:hypothetical protein